MPLTSENRRTPSGAEYFSNGKDLHHDVTNMDEGQLEKYMRMAFLGQRDEEFLPYLFWRHAFASYYKRGYGDGREPNPPGTFFGDMHGFVSNIINRHPEMDESWYDHPVNGEYLENLLKVTNKIMQEALEHPNPDDNAKQLAFMAVQTAEGVAGSHYSDTPYKKMALVLDPAREVINDERYIDLFLEEDTFYLSGWWRHEDNIKQQGSEDL